MLTLAQVLEQGTPDIDVLGIANAGVIYANMLLPQLNGRGTLYVINPHDDQMQHPGTHLDHTLLICDDVLDSGATMRKILAYLTGVGYDFERSNHYLAIACTPTYERIDEIVAVKDLMMN